MILNNPNGNNVAPCPLCRERGFLKFEVPILRNSIFMYEIEIDDCPLCEAYGLVEIKEDTKDERGATDNREGDFHSW